MKIAVFGTGMVGRAIATKLSALGHKVSLGSRTATNEKAVEWAETTGGRVGTFDQVCDGVDVIFNCTNGKASLEVLSSIDSAKLEDKVLIDVANELEFEDGVLKSLASANSSLAKKIQEAYPKAKVVKSLNTMNCNVMVEPSLVPGYHNVFMSGDSSEAKSILYDLLQEFGWRPEMILDLGGIDSAAGAEMLMGLWAASWASGNAGENGISNIAIVK